MTQTLALYQNRLPRYILQAQDNTLIRVAGPHQTPWEEATEIQNMSLSGLAFTAPADLSPQVGEMIKVQFEVPGSSQTACFGWVARTQPLGTSTVLVGLEFRKLEMAHRIVLAQGIAKKLRDQLAAEKKINRFNWSLFLKEKWKELLLMIVATLSWTALVYVLSTIFDKT